MECDLSHKHTPQAVKKLSLYYFYTAIMRRISLTYTHPTPTIGDLHHTNSRPLDSLTIQCQIRLTKSIWLACAATLTKQ